MMRFVDKEKRKLKLNGKTPIWFKDWYAEEFIPVHIKVNLVIGMAIAILTAVIVNGIIK